jgi:hypothetical protein
MNRSDTDALRAEIEERHLRVKYEREGKGYVSPVVYGQALDTIRDLRNEVRRLKAKNELLSDLLQRATTPGRNSTSAKDQKLARRGRGGAVTELGHDRPIVGRQPVGRGDDV